MGEKWRDVAAKPELELTAACLGVSFASAQFYFKVGTMRCNIQQSEVTAEQMTKHSRSLGSQPTIALPPQSLLSWHLFIRNASLCWNGSARRLRIVSAVGNAPAAFVQGTRHEQSPAKWEWNTLGNVTPTPVRWATFKKDAKTNKAIYSC